MKFGKNFLTKIKTNLRIYEIDWSKSAISWEYRSQSTKKWLAEYKKVKKSPELQKKKW